MIEKDNYNNDYSTKRGRLQENALTRLLEDPAVEAVMAANVKEPQKPLPQAARKSQEKTTEEKGTLEEVGTQIVGGARDAIQETMEAVESASEWLNENVLDLSAYESSTEINLPEVPAPTNVGGALTRGVSQFLTGFVGAAKFTGLGSAITTGSKVKRGIAAAALTDFTVFDPQAERLSNLVQEYPKLQNPVTEFLAAKPGDTELEGRFKNVLEGMGLDAVTAGAFIGSAKVIRAAKKSRGKGAKELSEELGDDFVEVDIKPTKTEELAAKPIFDEKPPKIKTVNKTQIAKTKVGQEPSPEKADDVFSLEIDGEEQALNINLARIDSDKDIKEIIKRTSEVFKPEIEKATRGKQSNQVTEKLADDLGLNVTDILQRKEGDAFNAEQLVAARKILVSSADNLKGLASKVNSPDVSDVDRIRLRRAVAVHAAIQKQVSGLTAEAGRALQSFRIQAKGQKEQLKAINDMLGTSGGRATADELAKGILEAENIRALNQYASKVHGASSLDMVLEAWMNSILSGPTTHMVNISSNMSNALLQIPERASAALIGKVLGGPDTARLGEASSQAYGMLMGIRDGWKMAVHAFKTEGLADPLTKIEGVDRRAITAGNVSKTFLGRNLVDPSLKAVSAKSLDEGGFASRFVDGLGTAIRFSGYRMLSAEDAFFKGMNYRMELHAQAYRTASEEGLRGKEFGQRVAQVLRDPPDEIRVKALEQAEVNTFTNPNQVAQGIQKITRKIPLAKFIVPFVNTPSNIIKFGFERSPFAILSSRIRDDIVAGGARRDLALAKMTLGSGAMMYASSLALEGKITGSGPKDHRLRKIWLQENQPYSFVFSNPQGKKEFVSYNRFEPMGMLFGFSADFSNVFASLDDKDADDLVGMGMLAFTNNVTSKTWLQGVSNVLDAINNPEQRGASFARNFAAGFVPNLLNQTNRAFNDPYLRDLDSVMDAMKSRVPGYSDDLPAKRNLWGDPIEPRAGFNDGIKDSVINLLSPAYMKEADGDPVNEVILDNEITIGMPRRTISVPGLGDAVDLTTEEYNRYVELAGKPAKEKLDDVINMPRFDSLSDGPEGDKARVVKRVISKFRRDAKVQLLDEFSELQDRIEDAIDQQQLEE